MVKGVRNARSSSKAALLRPLTLLEMDVTHRDNKGLQHIKEYKRAYNYSSLPFDTVKSSIALFMLEVVSKSLKEQDTHEDMFQFIYDCFCHIDEIETMNNDLHLQFLVHYAAYLGFAPHGEYSDATPYFDMQEGTFISQNSANRLVLDKSNSELISMLVSNSMTEPLPVRLTRHTRRDMLHHLLKYYSLHLEGFSGLRSPEVLEMIFD
jgi:DNA repair protein RecO (recombination protein O)